MARRTFIGQVKKTKEEQQADFLAAFVIYVSVVRSCNKSKVPRSNIYEWLKTDETFKALFQEAEKIGLAALEDEAIRRAHEGVLKPVYQQGKLVGKLREYSDTLLIVLLKARAPEKYKDRVQQEHMGKNGGPIDLSVANLPNIATEDLIRFLDGK